MHKVNNYAPIAQLVELPAFNRKGDVGPLKVRVLLGALTYSYSLIGKETNS